MQGTYDIVILGAGPAGSAAALALTNSNLKIALIDRSSFPRHKICGDAIPGKSQRFLREVWPEIDSVLDDYPQKENIKHAEVVGSNGKAITINWKLKAYNFKREDFDNILFQEVKRRNKVDILENHSIIKIKKGANDLTLIGTDESEIKCKIVIGCDGANSIVSKELAKEGTNRDQYGFAVAAYFENVDCPDETNLAYIPAKHQPGYFWIFPLGQNQYNVGFGLLGKSQRNLKKVLEEIIHEDSAIASRFKQAEQKSQSYTFGLPMGGNSFRRIQGERFMLCGDAAYLIDPLQGHGIDKAIRSGIIAAKAAEKGIAGNAVTSFPEYQTEIEKEFGEELKKNYRIMRFLSKNPRVVSFLTSIAQFKPLERKIQKLVYG